MSDASCRVLPERLSVALFAALAVICSLLAFASSASAGMFVTGITGDTEGQNIVMGPDAASRTYPREIAMPGRTPELFIGNQPIDKTVNLVQFSKLHAPSICQGPVYVTLDIYRYPDGSAQPTEPKKLVGHSAFPVLVGTTQQQTRWLTEEPLDLVKGGSYGFVADITGSAWAIDPNDADQVRVRDECVSSPLLSVTYPAVDPPKPTDSACVAMPITNVRPDARVFQFYRVWMHLGPEASANFPNQTFSDEDDVEAARICNGNLKAGATSGEVWAEVYRDSMTGEYRAVRTHSLALHDTDPTATPEELRTKALAPVCQQMFGAAQATWGFGVVDLIRGQRFGVGDSEGYEAWVMHKCTWASYPPAADDSDQSGWFWALPYGPGLPGPDGTRQAGARQIIDAELSSATSAPGLTDLREELGGENPAADVPRCNTGDPINCATGNYYEELTDVRISGLGVGLSVSRTYNAQAAVPSASGTPPPPGMFGRGWTSDFETKLLFPAPDTVIVQHGNGSTVPFKLIGTTWTAPDWARGTLTRTSSSASAGYAYKQRDRTVFKFLSNGTLLTVNDERGNTMLLGRTSGKVTRVSGGGHSLTLSYNAAGRVSSIADDTGRSVAYGYDSANELTSFTDVGGAVSTYAYDLRGRMTRKADARGGATVNVYDAQDRVIQQTDPMGSVTKLEYLGNPSGSKVKVTDRDGVVTLKVFTSFLPISETRGYGTSKAATVHMTHNDRGQLRRLIDASGNATTYRYDERGNRTQVQDALGNITKTTYDASDRPIETVSPLGRRTRITYDAVGNVVSTVRDSTGPQLVGSETRSYTYDAYGQLLTSTAPGGGVTTYTYDTLGNQTKVTTPGGRITTMAYDTRGGLLTTTLPAGNVAGATATANQITYTRNIYGAPLTVKDATGGVTTYTYDQVGNLIGVKDGDGRLTTTSYDLLGRKTQQVRPDGNKDAWTYTREGEELTRTDGGGSVWTNGYDAMGRRVSQTDPYNVVTTYEYDPAGNLTRVRQPDGSWVGYSYDELGRVRTVVPNAPDRLSNEAPTTSYAYDADGLIVRADNRSEESTIAWDALGRFEQRLYGPGSDARNDQGTTRVRYDAAGNIAQIIYPTGVERPAGSGARTTADFGTVSYRYGADNEMIGATGLSGAQYTFTYNANGDLTRAVYPGSRAAWFSRDAMGRPLSVLNPAGSRTYAYTPGGMRKTFSIDGTANALTTDPMRHLTGFGAKAFTYDASENPTQMYDGATPVKQGFLGQKLVFSTYANDAKLNYTHDELGRRTKESLGYNYSTFTWNELSQLKWATFKTRAGPYSRRDFTYGPTGLRKSSANGGVVKVEAWEEGLGSIAPMLTQGLEAIVYGPNGMLLERVGAGGTNVRYQWQDAIGTVMGGTSAITGTTTKLTYDTWGRRVSGNDAVVGTHGFAGQVTEPDTDYIYMRARWYDPQTGLFLSVDPKIDQTHQAYLYAGGNPTQYTDPSGEDFATDFANGMIQGLSQGTITPGSAEGSCSWGYFLGVQAGENVSPLGKAKKLDELLSVAKVGNPAAVAAAYHYTRKDLLESIKRTGLRRGSYVTKDGNLSPLQAQIDLALPPNRGLPGVLVRVDLDAMRQAGMDVGDFVRVARKYNMPGGGTELQFVQDIPPQFLTVVRG